MKLLVFAASHRKQSINRKLAALAAGFAEQEGASVDFPEYGDFDMPIYDDELFDPNALPEAAVRFVAMLRNAAGIIISSPEYNWSFPGSLKNIIDWASVAATNPFAGRTALLLSASPSMRGGAQGLVQLKEPLQHLGAFIYPHIFTLGRAADVFGDGEGFKDMRLREELHQLVGGFVTATKRLSGQ